MKNFNFRLLSYLKIKTFEEKLAWNEVLKQEARIQELNHTIEACKKLQYQNRLDVASLGSIGKFPLGGDLLEENYSALRQKIVNTNNELNREVRLLEKLKVKHLESKKELKSIDKLKEKKELEFKRQNEKVDAKKTAEVAMQFYNRGNIENE